MNAKVWETAHWDHKATDTLEVSSRACSAGTVGRHLPLNLASSAPSKFGTSLPAQQVVPHALGPPDASLRQVHTRGHN